MVGPKLHEGKPPGNPIISPYAQRPPRPSKEDWQLPRRKWIFWPSKREGFNVAPKTFFFLGGVFFFCFFFLGGNKKSLWSTSSDVIICYPLVSDNAILEGLCAGGFRRGCLGQETTKINHIDQIVHFMVGWLSFFQQKSLHIINPLFLFGGNLCRIQVQISYVEVLLPNCVEKFEQRTKEEK